MPRFCKVPLTIEAVQYTGTLDSAIECGCDDPTKPDVILEKGPDGKLTGRLIIATKEGPLAAQPGDWVITGVEGERYPCKPSVFEKTYVPAGDATPANRESYLKHLEAGVKRLADWIIANVPGEPCESQGAIDTAIRLLKRHPEAEALERYKAAIAAGLSEAEAREDGWPSPTPRLDARGLYEAYCASSDWKNFRGDPCPKWDDLPEAIRTHWQAVRDAA